MKKYDNDALKENELKYVANPVSPHDPLSPSPAEDDAPSRGKGKIEHHFNLTLTQARSVLGLLCVPGSKNVQYGLWWFVGLSMIGVYCWLNYILVDGVAVFSTMLYDFSVVDNTTGLAPDATLEPNATFTIDDARDEFTSKFIFSTWSVALYLTVTSLIYSLFLSVSHAIAEINREHITAAVMDKYLSGNVYYQVNQDNREFDNLQARFVVDVKQFGWQFVNCLFGNIYYTGIIPTVGQAIAFTWLVSSTGGDMAVWIAYTSFIIFIIINSILSKWVANAKYDSETDGANLESAQAYLITHSEDIAFYRGAFTEKKKLNALFKKTQASMGRYYFRFFFINYAVNFYYWFSTILNYALPGLVLIYQKRNTFSPADVAQVVTLTTYNSYLQSTLCYSIYCTEAFSHAMAHGLRVVEARDFIEATYRKLSHRSSMSLFVESDHLEIKGVTAKTPLNQLLVSNLNFKCSPTDSLLITGPSGSGKSSILRIICGLWPASGGSIQNVASNTFYMPQKPFLTTGTLREQFAYPPREGDTPISDEEIMQLLDTVNMSYLYKRFDFDVAMDWPNILSVGEQQRVGMSRVLYRKPRFAVLDECTSAVPSAVEAKFYQFLRDSGATFISVAHREAVKKYHEYVLALDGKSNYTFLPVDKEAEIAAERASAEASAASRKDHEEH